MNRNKLLIVFCISAGVLSFLLYRAVVNAPVPRETRSTSKQVTLIPKDLQQGQVGEKKATFDFLKKSRVKAEVTKETYSQQGPFEDTEELSPEEKQRIFEEEMKAHIPPGMSPEEAFRKSMDMDRMEQMSEQEKEEAFLRSMGGQQQLTDEERRALFEESMGIK